MRYEFDHRTGGMVPKKDDSIYFAQSQGGGLIVDDKKNNVKYIIERDERITKLFGSFRGDSLNFYDMRDARMISDRVIRLLGRNHKYSDFHYFLKGYHMSENLVKNCSNFLNESVWGDIHKRSSSGYVKKEVGRVVDTLPDGTNLILPNEAFADDGELVKFDDGKFYRQFDDDVIIVIVSKDYDDTYYLYNEDEDEAGVNLSSCCTIDDSIRKEDFNPLLAIAETSDTTYNLSDVLINLTVDVQRDYTKFSIDGGSEEYLLFYNESQANDYAFEIEKDLLDGYRFVKEEIKRFRNTLGDGFFNEKSMKDELEESWYTYFDDITDDEKIQELISYNIVKETEEYFDVDEDGDVDTDLPTFDPDDYRDDYVEERLKDIDVIDEFISNFGYDGIEDFIDIEQLASDIVDHDGRGSVISSYDGEERKEEVNGNTYYIYRTN